MGKRSDFERIERDFYRTPKKAVLPLIPFLPKPFHYVEPCAGDGFLSDHLSSLGGLCAGESDIHPVSNMSEEFLPDGRYLPTALDLFDMTTDMVSGANVIITNPPWTRTKASGYLLHRIIEHLAHLKETWLLLDSDWMHTVQATPYMERYMMRAVAIGRVKWIEGSKHTGKDNCCWYQFHKDARDILPRPLFYGRGIGPVQNTSRIWTN